MATNGTLDAGMNKKKELAEFLLSEFRYDSVFMYHEDVDISFAKFNKLMSEERVSWMFSSGQIPASDAFVIYAVCMLGFATPVIVYQYLKIMKLQEPEKIIPCADVSGVRERLRACCGKGLLMCQSYCDKGNGTKYELYCTSHTGFVLARQLLGRHIYANDMLSTISVVDKMARVACAYVSLAIYDGVEGCMSFSGYGTENTFRENGNFTPIMFGKVIREDADKKTYIITEPIYFNFDKRLDNEPVRIERYRHRLKQLVQWAGMIRSKEGAETKVVVVCENLKGVRRAAELLNEVAPALDAYYTSERIMHKMSAKKLVSEGYLSVRYKNGEPSVVPMSLLG
jgi:hypothetical protein